MDSHDNNNDVRCRIVQLTPPGRGAIASLLLTGETAIDVAQRFFQAASRKPLSRCDIGRIVFGRWMTGDDRAAEELVLCRTSNREIEIHCHGGRAAIDAITQSLVSAGCVTRPWTEHAGENTDDAIAAEARIALANAATQRTAAILLDQLHGALTDGLRRIETEIAGGQLPEAIEQLTSLQRRAALGTHLTLPFRVVVAGRPNVGKSSLVNAMLGYGRAIVFDEPGTTRDLVTASTAIDGWPVELLDTAGVRTSGDDIEQQGVARARQAMASADLIVLLIDASQPTTDDDRDLISAVHEAPSPSLIAHNKCDLPPDQGLRSSPEISISATTGENVSQLLTLIAERLVGEPPSDGEAIPFTARQVRHVESAIACLHGDDAVGAATTIRQCRTNVVATVARRWMSRLDGT